MQLSDPSWLTNKSIVFAPAKSTYLYTKCGLYSQDQKVGSFSDITHSNYWLRSLMECGVCNGISLFTWPNLNLDKWSRKFGKLAWESVRVFAVRATWSHQRRFSDNFSNRYTFADDLLRREKRTVAIFLNKLLISKSGPIEKSRNLFSLFQIILIKMCWKILSFIHDNKGAYQHQSHASSSSLICNLNL